MKKLIFIFFILFTGCWNYRELNDLAITTAIAIDKKDDKYEVSILVANAKKNNSTSLGNSESETIVYSGTGKNISEALNEIDLISPKKLYIEHLSILVISKEIAEEGLINVLDYFLRNSESTKRFQIVLADNAKNVIKVLKPLEAYPASSISKNFKLSNESQAKSVLTLYSEFLYKYMEKGLNPILPTISIIGNVKNGSQNKSLEQTTPSAITKLDNMAIFKDDKLVALANKNESKAINIINNKIDQMNIYLKCNDSTTTIKILDLNTKIKIVDFKELKYRIIVSAEGSIMEDTCNDDLANNKNMEKLQRKTENQIKKMIKKGIRVAKKYETDIYGFGNLLYKKHPNEFEKYKDWDKGGFKNTNIDISVKVNIRFKGSAKKNIKEVKNED